MPCGRPIVISGPTAVGKGTVVAELLRRDPSIYLSVSATTRPPRPGEIDGVHYHFLTDDQFDDVKANGGFLEWAQVHNAYRYGTLRAPLEQALAEGRTAICEIDLQGERQLRSTIPDAFTIFIAPPSWEELVSRLRGRGTESDEQMRQRLVTAKEELASQHEFDAVVINTTVEETVDKLLELVGNHPSTSVTRI